MLLSLLAPRLYVQIAPDRLEVRDPKSGKSFVGPPELAIGRSPKEHVVAFGADARAAQARDPRLEVVNPFAHPRSLVSDFTVAEQLLKVVFSSLRTNSWLALAPRVVMHPLGEPEGGLTQIEIRAIHEMGLGAGADEATVWQGRRLTDEEVLSGQFPREGRVLE